MPLSAGTYLGSYEVVAPIGSGGMGEVYQARDTRLDHPWHPQGISRHGDDARSLVVTGV